MSEDSAAVRPQRIRLEASSHCQLRCPSCPTTTGAIDTAVGKGFLRAADFAALLERNPGLVHVELSNYGEIFLNPELSEILRIARQRGVAITAHNGVNFNNVSDTVLADLVRYQVRMMVCSIDGASQETYARYRVRGNFDRVIGNIRSLNEIKRASGSQLPRLVWQFVIFGHNEHELPQARRMAAELEMEFSPKLTWDDGFSPIRDAAFIRAETGLPAASRAEFRAVTGNVYLGNICKQLWEDPQVNWDGKMLGCGRNFWGDFGANAFTEGLEAAVNSEPMRHARDMLRGRAPARGDIPCTTCEMYLHMRESGNFLGEDGTPVPARARRPRESR